VTDCRHHSAETIAEETSDRRDTECSWSQCQLATNTETAGLGDFEAV